MIDSADLPAMRELTDMERRFVEEYCVDWFQTAAARRAGYSVKSAKSIGRDLMKRPEVRAAIERHLEELGEDARTRSESVLNELSKVAFMPVKASSVASKVRALELLGKYRRLFVERSEVSAALDIQLHVSGARERIAARLARMIGA